MHQGGGDNNFKRFSIGTGIDEQISTPTGRYAFVCAFESYRTPHSMPRPNAPHLVHNLVQDIVMCEDLHPAAPWPPATNPCGCPDPPSGCPRPRASRVRVPLALLPYDKEIGCLIDLNNVLHRPRREGPVGEGEW